MLRILITDDHPVYRKGLRVLLADEPAFEVVGEAATAADAIALYAELQPDIVLMDLQMPGGSGIQAIRQISQFHPQSRVLVLTLFDDDSSIFAALRAGAQGYLLKDADEVEIVRAIQAVAGGDAIFSATVAARMVRFFSSPSLFIPAEAFPELTGREREILGLLAQGLKPAAIATDLSLSPKTVSNYTSSIINKLQVADRAEAVARAREAGLGKE